MNTAIRVGVYVDGDNIAMNGGYGMQYDVLREFACRGNAEIIRLNTYLRHDADRERSDQNYRTSRHGFYSLLRDFGYKVITKNIKWYVDEDNNRFGKANADLDLAVDALLQSENIDRLLLVTGDGDFVQVVHALQNMGCRVEVVGFKNVSSELRNEADVFISGFLIPNLLPTNGKEPAGWGEIKSRVRGTCYAHSGKGYGFIRFMKKIGEELWRIDSRKADSPYVSVFFHDTELPEECDPGILPSRNIILEFDLAKGERGLQAEKITIKE